MIEARTWLPPGADTGKAEAAFAKLLADWSGHWFAESRDARARGLARMEEAGRELRTITWHRCDAGAAIGVGAGGAIALGARAMDVAAGIGDRTPADLLLLRQLGDACFQDLRQRVPGLLGLPGDTQWAESAQVPASEDVVYRAELRGRGDPVPVAIAVTPSRLARLIKSRLPAPPALAALASPEAALAGTKLGLSAMLGACEVTLAEVEALAPGDVLVLDRHIDQALPLAIEYLPASRGACTVAQSGDRLTFQLTQALSG